MLVLKLMVALQVKFVMERVNRWHQARLSVNVQIGEVIAHLMRQSGVSDAINSGHLTVATRFWPMTVEGPGTWMSNEDNKLVDSETFVSSWSEPEPEPELFLLGMGAIKALFSSSSLVLFDQDS
ncbi:hypothetical protein WICPIJ_003629 [Wickerhamomyces pijperi]|uniref:Uncharacterized protein n=1 Tax=Wickerhamomyces pijperi TaxID=599730 RepID=A0A9P8Q7G0_WICPI|nr:hypothetical protein WICPIJ_003629 [Wickerhamomyces pijperi]